MVAGTYNVVDLPDINPEDEVIVEVIEHDAPLTERSVARRIALQVLYELDCTEHNAEQVVENRLQAQEIGRKGSRYVQVLVKGVLANRERLDPVIRQYATEWPLEQVAIIDRNILRMAIYEFAIAQSTPVATTIDEAVNLARLFGADSSTGFVNGVLGKLALNEDSLRRMLSVSEGGEVRE